MESGPYRLYDDENFAYIFQHCVHFIGSVNIFEENDKETGQNLTSKSLLTLRATCHDCLQFFNDLIDEWGAVNDATLNKATIKIIQLIEGFQEIMEKDLKRLDIAAKEESLPDIIRRLGLIIEAFILYREDIAHTKDINMANKNNKIPPTKDPFNQSINTQYLNDKNTSFFLLQFDFLYNRFQRHAESFKKRTSKGESYELKEKNR